MRSMRLILWLVLVLGVLWGGYWFVGARAVEAGAATWFADQKAAGLVADNNGLAVAGFADRFDLTVTDPHLADPVSGWGWQAPFAQIFAMTWKPWHLIAALPNAQEVDLPDGQKLTVGSARMMASLMMRPSLDLPFDRAVMEAEALTLTSDAGWQVGADKVVLAAQDDATRANTLRLGADVTQLQVPAALAHIADLGPTVAVMHLDVSAAMSAPLGNSLQGKTVVGVTVTSVHVVWGAMELTATGSVKPDATGLAEGKIDMALKGWNSLPALVVALGLVPPQNQVTVQRGLEFLANSGSDPDALTLPLTFAGGYMSLGPLPLGPAPRLQ